MKAVGTLTNAPPIMAVVIPTPPAQTPSAAELVNVIKAITVQVKVVRCEVVQPMPAAILVRVMRPDGRVPFHGTVPLKTGMGLAET